MFGTGYRYEPNPAPLENAVRKAKFENLRHAIGSIRKDAVESIGFAVKDRDESSPPGTPFFAHSGLARISLLFDVDADSAVTGFTFSRFGLVGETHEEGKTEEGRKYPERPVVGPALLRGLDRFHEDWRTRLASSV